MTTNNRILVASDALDIKFGQIIALALLDRLKKSLDDVIERLPEDERPDTEETHIIFGMIAEKLLGIGAGADSIRKIRLVN